MPKSSQQTDLSPLRYSDLVGEYVRKPTLDDHFRPFCAQLKKTVERYRDKRHDEPNLKLTLFNALLILNESTRRGGRNKGDLVVDGSAESDLSLIKVLGRESYRDSTAKRVVDGVIESAKEAKKIKAEKQKEKKKAEEKKVADDTQVKRGRRINRAQNNNPITVTSIDENQVLGELGSLDIGPTATSDMASSIASSSAGSKAVSSASTTNTSTSRKSQQLSGIYKPDFALLTTVRYEGQWYLNHHLNIEVKVPKEAKSQPESRSAPSTTGNVDSSDREQSVVKVAQSTDLGGQHYHPRLAHGPAVLDEPATRENDFTTSSDHPLPSLLNGYGDSQFLVNPDNCIKAHAQGFMYGLTSYELGGTNLLLIFYGTKFRRCVVENEKYILVETASRIPPETEVTPTQSRFSTTESTSIGSFLCNADMAATMPWDFDLVEESIDVEIDEVACRVLFDFYAGAIQGCRQLRVQDLVNPIQAPPSAYGRSSLLPHSKATQSYHVPDMRHLAVTARWLELGIVVPDANRVTRQGLKESCSTKPATGPRQTEHDGDDSEGTRDQGAHDSRDRGGEKQTGTKGAALDQGTSGAGGNKAGATGGSTAHDHPGSTSVSPPEDISAGPQDLDDKVNRKSRHANNLHPFSLEDSLNRHESGTGRHKSMHSDRGSTISKWRNAIPKAVHIRHPDEQIETVTECEPLEHDNSFSTEQGSISPELDEILKHFEGTGYSIKLCSPDEMTKRLEEQVAFTASDIHSPRSLG